MRRAYMTCLSLILLISCQQKRIIDGTYTGLFYETEWRFSFDKKGRFTLESIGHLASNSKSGRYYIQDDFFVFLPDSIHSEDVLPKHLKIIQENSCIRDEFNHFFCADIDSINYYIDLSAKFDEKTSQLLDTFPAVIESKKNILKEKHLADFPPKILYNRIFFKEQTELHHFQLVASDGINFRPYMSFYVQEKPFKIFELAHFQKDSLKLIYDE